MLTYPEKIIFIILLLAILTLFYNQLSRYIHSKQLKHELDEAVQSSSSLDDNYIHRCNAGAMSFETEEQRDLFFDSMIVAKTLDRNETLRRLQQFFQDERMKINEMYAKDLEAIQLEKSLSIIVPDLDQPLEADNKPIE